MKSKISKIGMTFAMIAITFTTKCANEDEADKTSEIVIPNIVKTDSQLRDEAYRADPIYGEIKNLEDYWLAFKTIGEKQYGYDFGDQEVKIDRKSVV